MHLFAIKIFTQMRVISFRKIREFIDKDSVAKVPMTLWFKKVQKAEWNNYAEMKVDFGSVDAVGNQRYVFNIMGNHYRIIAKVLFQAKTVYVRFVGKHKDYDKIKNIENL